MERLETYDQAVAEQMKNLYQSLSEKDQRRYAAIEAKKLGYGGISYICRLFGCDPSSVRRGLSELATPLKPRDKQIRAAGGGRKRLVESLPDLDETFLAIMTPGCLLGAAGSPMDETIKWSNLSREQIAATLASKGFAVSVTVVDQLLAKHDFCRRQAFKNEADKQVEQRDEQFKNIEQLVENARTKGNPVMSMDVKKKN
jgi:Rhodopirellula transposase DDE domain